MKKILSVLFLLLFLFGCSASEETEIAGLNEWGIDFYVTEADSYGATLVFSRNGENAGYEFTTGSYYRIERDNEEPEIVAKGEINWIPESHFIPSGGCYKVKINWKWLYGKLEPGTYRIIKLVTNDTEPGDLVKHYSAEFSVE